MTVFVDITEFMSRPLKSGIQRVVRQIIRCWPKHLEARFVSFDPGTQTLRSVPRKALEFAVRVANLDGASDSFIESEMRYFISSKERAEIAIKSGDSILVPEVFYDQDRVRYYHWIRTAGVAAVYFLVFDFVPWLRPDVVRLGAGAPIMPYLRLIMTSRWTAFISTSVRDEFVGRIRRGGRFDAAGPVIRLGGDGLPLERQFFDPSRSSVVCLGAFDGKKGQELVFRAFKNLADRRNCRLVFLGHVPPSPAPWLSELLSYSGDDVRVVNSPSDAAVADYLRGARATVFVSQNEGFGLPAIESLYCGIPVLAHENLPALSGLPAVGQIRIKDASIGHIQTAFRQLLDGPAVERLWKDAAGLNVRTWRDFTGDLASWAARR